MSSTPASPAGLRPDPGRPRDAAPDVEGARHRALDDGGGPGTTTIENGVVEKIAGRAVTEIPSVGGTATRVLGIALGSDSSDQAPKVTAHVDGTVVTVSVRCSVTYPAPIGATTRAARKHVMERVATLTGLSVRQVDVTVTSLTSPPAPSAERVIV